MCDAPTSGHRELWQGGSTLPADRGPEGNIAMWRSAEQELDFICEMHERGPNEALTVALVDTYNRCIEERRRAEELLELHKRWRERPIGGVTEPEGMFRDRPSE